MEDNKKLIVIGNDNKLMRGVTSAIHSHYLALGIHKSVEVIERKALGVISDLHHYDFIEKNEKMLDWFPPSKNDIWKERMRKLRNS